MEDGTRTITMHLVSFLLVGNGKASSFVSSETLATNADNIYFPTRYHSKNFVWLFVGRQFYVWS